MDGKVFVVVGASQGLGRSLVDSLSSEHNAYVIAASRNVSSVLGNSKVVPVSMDICDVDQCHALYDRTLAEFNGRVDGLILCTGVNSDYPLKDWQGKGDAGSIMFKKILDINLVGWSTLISIFLDRLSESNGIIVAISSMAGLFPVPGGSHYAASKHACEGFLESIRPELRAYGIRLLIVEPGSMRSEDGTKRQVLGIDGNIAPASENGTYRGGKPGEVQKRQPVSVVSKRIIEAILDGSSERIYSQYRIVIFFLLFLAFWFPIFFEKRAIRNRFPNGIPAKKKKKEKVVIEAQDIDPENIGFLSKKE